MLEVQHVTSDITLDATKAVSMQTLYEVIASKAPNQPGTTVIGIDIPLIGWECRRDGTINPLEEIKEAVTRLFNINLIDVLKAVFEKLLALLKAIGGSFLDLTLPVLELKVSDVFRYDFIKILAQRIKELFESGKAALNSILDFLGIPRKFFDNIIDAGKEVWYLTKAICDSLVSAIIRKIKQIIDLIQTLIGAWAAATKRFDLKALWDAAVNAVISYVLEILATGGLTVQQIISAVKELAYRLYGEAGLLYHNLVEAIKLLSLPIFGRPIDWKLPINPSLIAPNIDFVKLITDIKTWLNNFLVNILKKFLEFIVNLLNFLGITLEWLAIVLPIRFCVITNTPTAKARA